MAPGGGPNRRLILVIGFTVILILVWMTSHHSNPQQRLESLDSRRALPTAQDPLFKSTPPPSDRVISKKIGNETLKAELGRAAWKLFHTTMAQFPDSPTKDESEALRSYIHLFQRLYPCGECAEHFGQLLKKFPPQVSSRSAAAVWACHVHNEVNKSLKKDIFDCSKIGDFYDCGCADDEKLEDGKGVLTSQEGRERLIGANGGSLDGESDSAWREIKAI